MKFFERWIRRQVDYAAHAARQVLQDTRLMHSVLVHPSAPPVQVASFGVTVLGQCIDKVKAEPEGSLFSNRENPEAEPDDGPPLAVRLPVWRDVERMGVVGAWGRPDGAGDVRLVVQTQRPIRIVQILTYGPPDWFLSGWWKGSDFLFDSIPCAVAWNDIFFEAIELPHRNLRLLPGEHMRFELSQVRQ